LKLKNKILLFTKKYPLSILLAIIALHLFSIAGSLETSAKTDQQKMICLNADKYTNKQLRRKLGTEIPLNDARILIIIS
tara:strand:+ start:278 stop:514 length:237 start_codon:yes stop_codon:yes gene_type:complete